MRRLLILTVVATLAAFSSGCCSCLTGCRPTCCLTKCSCWHHFCCFEDWKMQNLFGVATPAPFTPAPVYTAPPVYQQPQAYVTPATPCPTCPCPAPAVAPAPVYTQPLSAGAGSPAVNAPYEVQPAPICAPIPACQPCPCVCPQPCPCPSPCTCNSYDSVDDGCSSTTSGTVITTPGPVIMAPSPTPAPTPAPASGATTQPAL